MKFSEISKSKKFPQKSLKSQKLKKSKSYKEASNKKSSVNNLQLELKNIKNDIFENFKK